MASPNLSPLAANATPSPADGLDPRPPPLSLDADSPFAYLDDESATNSTFLSSAPDPFYFYKTPQLIVLWALFFLIVVGNSSVLVALTKHKGRKSRMNFFITHLAFADLLVGLVNVLIDILSRFTIDWHWGNVGCKFVRYFQVLITYSSTYVLVALSIDRYDAITRPMKFSGSWRRAKFLIGSAWALSAVFSIPIPIIYEEKIVGGRTQCWLEFSSRWQWKCYMTLVACAVFVVPALVIVVCYAVIVCTIWSKSGAIVVANSRRPPPKSVRESILQSKIGKFGREEYESRRASSRGLIPRAKVKTIKMTFVIVFVFILCWSPYIVFDLLQVYEYIPETQTTVAVASFVQSLAPLNSAANPVIYCLFSTRTCCALWKLPPLKWVVSGLSACFPALGRGSRTRLKRGCLRYGESSATVTETITQSSKRCRLASANSLRQIVVLRVNSPDARLDRSSARVDVTVV